MGRPELYQNRTPFVKGVDAAEKCCMMLRSRNSPRFAPVKETATPDTDIVLWRATSPPA
jgi:hypothetical protein